MGLTTRAEWADEDPGPFGHNKPRKGGIVENLVKTGAQF
jgi:hypothetical protein